MKRLKIGNLYKNAAYIWLLLGNNENEDVQVYFRSNTTYGITEYAIVSNTQFRDNTINGIYWDYSIAYCYNMQSVLMELEKKEIEIIGINNKEFQLSNIENGGREI
jgi:hypothetical protein